ncbi:IclR family transcriptional regulator [Nocardioides nematodiphilus]|uniref:IclR family transcriptional regulator n=1 Tax=Nocardioides nematodiphilus TaxID=2849669 RepID=UPI001CD93885|nr:helix-turn-helix domain-containing protein [Nocardioides nematodiphilus]MCA1983232.1 helix-turn-helix domain-containing protein [Nocardioides nematodiphilus]
MSTATAELFESKRSVLGRAFDILECFAGGEQEQSITALCAHTGLPPATVHRMLANLVEWGAIERAGRGRYRLGRRLWRLGSDVPSSRALKDVARPCLVDLHAMTGEVAVLSSIDGERMVVADVIAGRTAFRSWTAPRNMPIAGTAPGRVMLAHLPLEESRRLLERADAEITHQASDFGLRQQLGEIRRTGVAVAPFAGKVWVSAPIFDEVGAIRSTISAVADQDHHNLPGLTHIVTGAARAVSQGLRERAASAV